MGPFLFAEIKTGCRKAQSEGYGSVLERARSTPLRVASPESSAALGQRFRWTAAAEALRVATVKAPGAWLRFAERLNVQLGRSSQSGIVALVVILIVILVVILVVSSEASSVSQSVISEY